MKIIDRLPISERPHILSVGEDVVQVYRNQIIVWLSIDDALRPFPAVLDTGHGHNLSLSETQLARWSVAMLLRIGELQMDQRRVVQYAAEVRLHCNVRGKTELKGDSYPLEMPQGITVLPEGDAPRLPLIGLRAIVANKLRLLIDGKKREVSVY